jgi:uncharacterized RDD family membrane protein YckC
MMRVRADARLVAALRARDPCMKGRCASPLTEHSAAQELFSIETPESVAFAYELAGLGSRGVALALDMLLLALLWLGEAAAASLVAYLLNRTLAPAAFESAIAWIVGVTLVVAFATTWVYFVVCEVARNGRTWGKQRVGLRVVRDDGSRVGLLDSVIRNLLRIVDILPGNYAVGMICIVLNKKHKRVGDMAAGTVVVRDTGDLALRFDGGEDSRRIALAREFLERRPGLTPEARYQVGTAILKTFGEEPPAQWDEPTLAGRIADLCGWRDPGTAIAGEGPDPDDAADASVTD